MIVLNRVHYWSKIIFHIEPLDSHYIICGGDMNYNMHLDDVKATHIKNTMSQIGLYLCNSYLNTPSNFDYTFAVINRNAYSLIDHFFVSGIQPNYARSLSANNFSDHLPVVLQLDNAVIKNCQCGIVMARELNDTVIDSKTNFDWINTNKSLYYELTRDLLEKKH